MSKQLLASVSRSNSEDRRYFVDGVRVTKGEYDSLWNSAKRIFGLITRRTQQRWHHYTTAQY